MKTYFDIFIAFLRCGIFGFGGGQATIPLIQEEVVEKFKWVTIEEFTDALAFGNSLPGPIATKMSALIGYKMGGIIGSLIGLIALILPSTIAIIALMNIYLRFKDAAWLKGMMKGVRPVIVILILQVVVMIGKKAFVDVQTIAIAGVAAIISIFFNIHPAFVIVMAMIYGGVFLA